MLDAGKLLPQAVRGLQRLAQAMQVDAENLLWLDLHDLRNILQLEAYTCATRYDERVIA